MRIAFAMEIKGDLICAMVHQLNLKTTLKSINLSEVEEIDSLAKRFIEMNIETLKSRYSHAPLQLSIQELLAFTALYNVFNVIINNYDQKGVFINRFPPYGNTTQNAKHLNLLVNNLNESKSK